METLKKLEPIFADVLDLENLELTPETSAHDIPEWDSLSHIQLILAIEKAFKLKFKSSEISGLKNVGEMAQLIDSKI